MYFCGIAPTLIAQIPAGQRQRPGGPDGADPAIFGTPDHQLASAKAVVVEHEPLGPWVDVPVRVQVRKRHRQDAPAQRQKANRRANQRLGISILKYIDDVTGARVG